MTVVVRQGRQLLLTGHRLLHCDHADLMVEFMDDRDLPWGGLKDLEWIGSGEHARQPVRHAVSARGVDDRALLQARGVFFISLLASWGERQVTATDDSDLGSIFGRPVGSSNLRRLTV